jgi:hypothetical protein
MFSKPNQKYSFDLLDSRNLLLYTARDLVQEATKITNKDTVPAYGSPVIVPLHKNTRENETDPYQGGMSFERVCSYINVEDALLTSLTKSHPASSSSSPRVSEHG